MGLSAFRVRKSAASLKASLEDGDCIMDIPFRVRKSAASLKEGNVELGRHTCPLSAFERARPH